MPGGCSRTARSMLPANKVTPIWNSKRGTKPCINQHCNTHVISCDSAMPICSPRIQNLKTMDGSHKAETNVFASQLHPECGTSKTSSNIAFFHGCQFAFKKNKSKKQTSTSRESGEDLTNQTSPEVSSGELPGASLPRTFLTFECYFLIVFLIRRTAISARIAHPKPPKCERCVQFCAGIVDINKDCASQASKVLVLCATLCRNRRHHRRLRTPSFQNCGRRPLQQRER